MRCSKLHHCSGHESLSLIKIGPEPTAPCLLHDLVVGYCPRPIVTLTVMCAFTIRSVTRAATGSFRLQSPDVVHNLVISVISLSSRRKPQSTEHPTYIYWPHVRVISEITRFIAIVTASSQGHPDSGN